MIELFFQGSHSSQKIDRIGFDAIPDNASEIFIKLVHFMGDGYHTEQYANILHKIAGPAVNSVMPRLIQMCLTPGFHDPPYCNDGSITAKSALTAIGAWAYEGLLIEQDVKENDSTRSRKIDELIDLIADQLRSPMGIPVLIRMLQQQNTKIQKRAIKILTEMGSKAKQALPILIDLTSAADKILVSAAIEAVEKSNRG